MTESLAGAGLAARALLRAFVRHRFRAVAAIVAGIACVALTTSVLVIASSVEDAIKGVSVSSLARAEWIVQARSSSGMSLSLRSAMQAAAPSANLDAVLLANTRLAAPGETPLVVVGTNLDIIPFLPRRDLGAVESLAEPNTVVLNQAFARAHGLRVGSNLPIETPSGRTLLRVASLVADQAGNGGALAFAGLSTVQRAFEREGVTDAVLASGPEPARLRRELQRAVGEAGVVVAPSQVTASYQKAFMPTQNLLDIFVAVAVFAAGAILFFCWRLALEDAREQLARLRLCGAQIKQLALAAVVVMGGVFVISVLVGGPVGILLGVSLSGFARTLITLTQLAAAPATPIVQPLTRAIVLSLVIFGLSLGTSLLTIWRLPVIEAVVGRRAVDRVGSPHWRLTALVAGSALAASLVCLLALPAIDHEFALVPLIVVLGSLSLLAPAFIGSLIRRRPSFASLGAGRELALSAPRTASLLSVFAIAIAMAIALQGAAGSLERGISRGVEAWTGNYIFVQPAQSGANLQDDKFASAITARLQAVPGVSQVGSFTYSTVELHGTRIPLWTWGPTHMGRYANMRSVAGPSGEALWAALGGSTVAVSSNYARLYGTKVGDEIAVPALVGARKLRVVAIVDDLTTATGMLLVGPQQYLALTGDHRQYEEILRLAPGASLAAVKAGVKRLLAPQYPGVAVYDQRQIRGRFSALTGQLVQAFAIFGRIMFVLALLIGGATLATGLSLRQRSLALSRLVGAPVVVIRRQLRREAVALGVAAWLIAAPIGVGLVYALIATIATQSGLLPRAELPITLILLGFPLAIVMSLLSLAAAAPSRRIPVTVAALAEE